MKKNFEIIYADKMDDAYQSIIIEAFNKDAREKKGLTSDLKSFSFSCLNQDKNFIAGLPLIIQKLGIKFRDSPLLTY